MNITNFHQNQSIKLKKIPQLISLTRKIPSKAEMVLFLLLSSTSAFAYQTDIGTVCDGGAVICSNTSQNNTIVDASDGSVGLEQTHVWDGGVIQNNTVRNGGNIFLHQNAIAYDTTVDENGFLQIENGAQARGMVDVFSNGTVRMHTGAHADAVFLNETDTTLELVNTNTATQNISFEVLANNGKVVFNHPSNDGYIVANVDYLSGSGLFQMRVDGQVGDFLSVSQSTEGDFTVQVVDTGRQVGANSHNYHLITAENSRDGQFALLNGSVELGAYKYTLERDDPSNPYNWYLRALPSNGLSESAKSVISLANVTPTIWDSELSTLRARLGELRDGATTNHLSGVWSKVTSSRFDVSTNNVGYKQETNGVVIGNDRVIPAANGQFLLGGMFSYGQSDIDFQTAGDGTVDSYSAGIYGTYLMNSGYYVDAVVKLNQFKTKNNVQMQNGARADGSDNTTGFGLSIEAGKYIKINDYFVEPYIMLSTFRAESSDYTLSNGLKTQADATESFKTEIGLTFGKTWTLANSAIIKPYARLAINQEFQDSNNLTINDTEHFNNDMSGTVGKVGLGFTAQLTGAWSAYAEINYANGDHVESPYNGHLGVRYSF